ncbi:hypothetical protein QYF49_05180 [Fictibacillus sp. CENA-BCM004]|uniref:Uncharacterized protein n=1 Tax=Fictibacillus terranigra TaxID=3058424 RepID=A0ABT8E3E1_9BACL|nr:hypothetical protein [Fictibacillus sp. CENA-BCM004]MDN4072422.1 hypothetical protein [Fictibacillus sp. CENA-BCM004]
MNVLVMNLAGFILGDRIFMNVLIQQVIDMLDLHWMDVNDLFGVKVLLNTALGRVNNNTWMMTAIAVMIH